MDKPLIDVALVPSLFDRVRPKNPFVVVLIDILRATTTICTALQYGAKAIIPVATLQEAQHLKEKGYLVAAEREGIKPDFADLGNSALNFMTPLIQGKEIVYSTTNGTQAFECVKDEADIAIGAFVNISTLAHYLIRRRESVIMLCSGWKGRFNLEDTVFAGALAERLIFSGEFVNRSDAVNASLDLWSLAKTDLLAYHCKAEHHERLKRLGIDDVVPYTFTPDTCSVVPLGRDGIIRRAEDF